MLLCLGADNLQHLRPPGKTSNSSVRQKERAAPLVRSMDNGQFDDYYEEFTMVLKKLSTSSTESSNSLLTQGRELLDQMRLEVRSLQDADFRQEQMDLIRQGQEQLDAIAKQLRYSCVAPIDGPTSVSMAENTNDEKILCKQNEILQRAKQTLAEAEEIGEGITMELDRNRATILSSQKKMDDVQSLTDRANQLVKSLSKPFWQY